MNTSKSESANPGQAEKAQRAGSSKPGENQMAWIIAFFVSSAIGAIAGDCFGEDLHWLISFFAPFPISIAVRITVGFLATASACAVFYLLYRDKIGWEGLKRYWITGGFVLAGLIGLQWAGRGLHECIERSRRADVIISGVPSKAADKTGTDGQVFEIKNSEATNAKTEELIASKIRKEKTNEEDELQSVLSVFIWGAGELAAFLVCGVICFRSEEKLGRLRTENRSVSEEGNLVPTKTREHIATGEKVKGLVLFVSPPTRMPEINEKVCRFHAVDSGNHFDVDTGSVNSAIASFRQNSPRHNWLQLLRALKDLNIDDIGHVWLVGSKPRRIIPNPAPGIRIEDEAGYGSRQFCELCEGFLRRFLREGSKFHPVPETEGVEFDDIDELGNVVGSSLEAAAKFGIKDDEIVVDVTGGTKIASIVGAVLTLNERTLIQYEPTHNGDSLIYDAKIGAPRSNG